MEAFKEIVLVVDGDAIRRNRLNQKIRLLGYMTELCTSGFNAISILEKAEKNQKKYPLVIISGHTDDMPSKEIVIHLRTFQPKKEELAILFIGQGLSTEEILEIIDFGANDFIVRSDNMAKAMDKIQKLYPLKK